MNKKCIYTALTGGYDNLNQPQVIDDSFDYICFSNDIKQNKVGIWQIRQIPFYHKDNTRVSRYPKFHPHVLLNEYEFSVYIDANNVILDNYIYKRANELHAENAVFGHVVHPYRDCIYKEIFDCMFYGNDRWIPLFKSLRFLLRNNFPFKAGLYENNLIFWNHHVPIVSKVLDDFWALYLKKSHRDQLSLRYIYYINGIKPALILPVGEHMGNSTHIKRVEHTGNDRRKRLSPNKYKFNKLKIRITRMIFMLMGYNLTYKKLYSK